MKISGVVLRCVVAHVVIRRAVHLYSERPCLGTRIGSSFHFITYSQVASRAFNLGSGLMSLGLKPVRYLQINASLLMLTQFDKVGIYSQNRLEWVLVEQACNAFSLTVVPIYDTLGEDVLEYIMQQAGVSCLVCGLKESQKALACVARCRSVRLVLLMDEPATSVNGPTATPAAVTVSSIAEVEARGEKSPMQPVPPQPDTLAVICYTSGSTGDAKGVMLTHANMVANVCGELEATSSDVYLSYLPLAHPFEREMQVLLLGSGAAIGFYQGDVLKLFDDIATLRPTIFASVPRLYNRLYDKVMSRIRTSPFKRLLFNVAMRAKKAQLAAGVRKLDFWDTVVFAAIRSALGGRVHTMVTGSAPIAAEVKDFLRVCFFADVFEGYGQTEATACVCISLRGDWTAGHVGPPAPSCEIKLVDVPEMNYTSRDIPFPRGEVCVRGPCVFLGYYKADALTYVAVFVVTWCMMLMWVQGGGEGC